MSIRRAAPADRVAVANVVDGAALALPDETVAGSLADGATFLAVAGETDPPADGDERVLGALVLDGDRIAAVAVRRRRRGQGIGTALVRAAADRRDRLVAEFDASVRPFYESLGFEIEPLGNPDRYRGRLRGDPATGPQSGGSHR